MLANQTNSYLFDHIHLCKSELRVGWVLGQELEFQIEGSHSSKSKRLKKFNLVNAT